MNALLSRIDPTDLEVETNRRTLLLSWVTVSLPPLPCIPSMKVDSISTHLWFCLNLQQNPRSILAGLFFAQTTVLLQSVWCLCVYFPWAPVYLLSLSVGFLARRAHGLRLLTRRSNWRMWSTNDLLPYLFQKPGNLLAACTNNQSTFSKAKHTLVLPGTPVTDLTITFCSW